MSKVPGEPSTSATDHSRFVSPAQATTSAFTTPRTPSPEIPSSESSPYVERPPADVLPSSTRVFDPTRLTSVASSSPDFAEVPEERTELSVSRTKTFRDKMSVAGRGEIFFSGKQEDCKPRIFLMYVKKVVKRENPDLELPEEQELENTFLIQAFQKYLRGKALRWFEEERLGEKTFEEIALQFEEKFSKPNTAEDSALIAEAHQISRAAGESLRTFVDRTGKLYHRMPPNYRQTLLTSFILRMNDKDKDQRLQERIQDRLYSRNKWNNGVADPTLTFDDVRNVIWDCRNAASETLQPFGEEGDKTEQENSNKMLIDSNREMAKLTSELARVILPTVRGGNYYPNNDSRGGNTQSYTGNNTGPVPTGTRERDPEMTLCFNCGLWGHMTPQCREPRDNEKIRYNRDNWQENARTLMSRRRAELNSLANRSRPPAMAKTAMMGMTRPRLPAGYRQRPNDQLTTNIPWQREGTNFTRQEDRCPAPWRYDEESPGESSTDISNAVPWRYDESYPGQSLGLPQHALTPAAESLEIDDSGRGAVPLAPKRFDASSRQVMALTTDQLAVNAATHGTEKAQPKPKNTAGIDKSKGRAKKTTMGDEQLKILADAATRQLQENTDRTTGRTLAETENPRVVELGDDEQPLPSQTQPADMEMMADFTREEFERMLPRLQPHLERLRLQNDGGNAVPAAERKPRHVLEKIRATDEYHVPPFEIGQHLKNDTIQISMLQLLQIAPSIRQQLSRLMQCRRRAKGTKTREAIVNTLGPFRALVEPAFAAELEREYGESDQSCGSLAQPRAYGNTTIWNDTASPEESVPNTLGYISGYLSGHHTDAILLDGGSVVNLVNQNFMNKSGIRPVRLTQAEPIRLANDEIAHVTEFVMLEVVVAKVMCHLAAYVMKGHEDWDLLVGRPWLRRVKAVEHHHKEKLIITGFKGRTAVVDITPSPRHTERIEDHGKDTAEVMADLAEPEYEELIYVDDDAEIENEVEDILADIHRIIQRETDAHHVAGN
ncbi:ribonuclease H [Fusarium pseudoanthophilum]|uniref:Ribonuclease H n=1 Tax=Fusarium pseudoanthophilum TaxID=48495 RepID=A0A8H5PXL3_9HYPO|nr:ribonuclease H [Fusarium pseudoanthophilum]